ncbi:hypothetical protein AALB16_01630 [Lachnospiraceae bacterium 62-35]
MRIRQNLKKGKGMARVLAVLAMTGFLLNMGVLWEMSGLPGRYAMAAEEESSEEERNPSSQEGLLEEPVRLESIGMEMKVPEGWITMTSEMEADDKAFTENNMDGEMLLKAYKSHGILIDSINQEERVEFSLVFSGKDETIVHLTQFSEEGLGIYGEGLAASEEEGENSGRLLSYEIYGHPQGKFITGETRVDGGGNIGKGQQYYTIVNGNRLCFQMISFQGELSESNKELLKSMIDSIRFESLEEAEPLAVSKRQNVWLKQLGPEYFLRNTVILLGLILLCYYGIKGWKRKKR